MGSKDTEVQLIHALDELISQRDSGSLSDIAACLDHVYHLHAELGHDHDALEAIEEAIQLRREAKDLDQIDLAVALQLQGQQFAKMGLLKEAISSVIEAIAVLRLLRAGEPERYLSPLAGSLHNLAYYHGLVGQWREASASMAEAVTLRRQLMQQDRTNATLLAAALHNLSYYHTQMGHSRQALAAASESLQLRRDRAARREGSDEDQASSLLSLSESLHTLSTCQVTLKRYNDAAQTTSSNIEAVWHLMWQQSPSTYTHHLTTTLHNSSTHLHRAGRSLEALTAAEESVHLRRQLAKDDPETHLPLLGQSLNTTADYLWKAGRTAEAILAAEEAVSIYRGLLGETDNLAFSLWNLGVYLEDGGRMTEAKQAQAEARKIDPAVERRYSKGLFNLYVKKVMNTLRWRGSPAQKPGTSLRRSISSRLPRKTSEDRSKRSFEF